MSIAKKIRLGKILNSAAKKSLIVPIDHGLTMGPLPGLESSDRIGRWLRHRGIDAILAHKGMISRLAEREWLGGRGVILHLNGMNRLAGIPDHKVMLTSLESAARLGVDAVSLQINFTGGNDAENWKMLSQVVDEAQEFGFPVLTMLYDKVKTADSMLATRRLRELLRVTVELGTDAVKIAMPESLEDLRHLLDPVRDDVLIFLAGGEMAEPQNLLSKMAEAMDLGVAGVCMGRNIFSNPNPEAFLDRLSAIVHAGPRSKSIREAVHAL